MRTVALTWSAVAVGLLMACGGSATALSPSNPTDPSNGVNSPTAATAPALASLSPTSGAIGAAVVVHGSNFASSGNSVKFGIGYIKNLSSTDGATLQFAVPDTLDPCPPDSTNPCTTFLARPLPGDYQVVVISGGKSSNSLTFTVTQ